MKLIQNTGTQRVIDLMRPHLKHGNRLDCVTPSFSLYAFAEIREALSALDQVQLIREEIENKQKQIQILTARQQSTTRTKELYQEQYKLGTRSVVDLLNSEQAIHSAAQEIETAKYDIYANLVQYIKITGRTRDLYQLNNISIQGFEILP